MNEKHEFIPAAYWQRGCAYLADVIIICIVQFIFVLITVGMFAAANIDAISMNEVPESTEFLLTGVALVSIISNWLYSSVLQSSELKATIGKLLFHIEVRDMDGTRLTFGAATARHFSRILSFLTIIGILMPLWTARRQTLHDVMTNSICVKL